MTVNEEEKKSYIKTNFHPYYDIELDSNITANSPVNIVILLEKLRTVDLYSSDKYYHDIPFSKYEKKRNAEIFSEYSNSSIQKDASCILHKIIDGDTLELRFTKGQYENINGLTPYVVGGVQKYPYKVKDAQNNDYYIDRIRLIGINTPEKEDSGGQSSLDFLKKICSEEDAPANSTDLYLNGTLSIKIDSQTKRDKYGRVLAVLFVDYTENGNPRHINVNEVLLKEGLAEIMHIPPSDFTPSQWAGPKTQTSTYHKTNDSINKINPFLNEDLTNLVFTPDNDLDTIYQYEVYKDILFLRIYPFSVKVRMHIMPKGYDCMDNLLIFKDEYIEEPKEISEEDYEYYSEKCPINCYFQTSEGDRDRTNPSIQTNYQFNKFTKAEHFYQQLDNGVYTEEAYRDSYCEFEHDISKQTKGFSNLQINAGYHYNTSTPYYALHYTGVKDETNSGNNKKTLIDGNFDNIFQDQSSNHIVEFDEKTPLTFNSKASITNGIDHLNLNKTYHKTIKYINDCLYVEEENKYMSADWEGE